MSRGLSFPLVTTKSGIDQDISNAARDLQSSVNMGGQNPVYMGRTPHVLSMLYATPNALPVVFDKDVQAKVFFGKHEHKIEGVAPAMIARAMHRPALVFRDTSEAANYVIVTNILTKLGPLAVNVRTDGDWRGNAAAIVKSVYPREHGDVADWINGKAKNRVLLYADTLQAPEVVTGRLNPENENPTRKGWDLVQKKGTINTVEHDARAATVPMADTVNVTKFGTAVNENYRGENYRENYRGARTIDAKLQQHLTGKGADKIKTFDDLSAWLQKHYKGDANDKPVMSRAPVQGTAAERADKIIKTNAATAKPIDAAARMLTRITGVERLTRELGHWNNSIIKSAQNELAIS